MTRVTRRGRVWRTSHVCLECVHVSCLECVHVSCREWQAPARVQRVSYSRRTCDQRRVSITSYVFV
jgi:hypothetical protein